VRVAIIGSRKCGSLTVEQIIAHLPSECDEIISGGAVGVDRLAREAARRMGIPLTEYLPDYHTFGPKAPLIRNQKIAEQADLILAFWDYESNGTRYTITQGMRRGKSVKIIPLAFEK